MRIIPENSEIIIALKNKSHLLFILLVLLTMYIAGPASAQKKVRLERADRLEGGRKDGRRYDSFIGNVIFLHQNATIYCDSAILYRKENSLEAYGHVRIDDGDSITVTSNTLIYDGNSRVAKLRSNVVFTKKTQMTLYTDFLDYDRVKEIAKYVNGGKIVDSTNVLSSEKGYYDVRRNMASFKTNVVGENPDYTMKSDTLQYNTKTKIIYFKDKTELTDVDGNVFVYSSGLYNTLIDKSDFSKGYIETESYFLYGDRLVFDDIRGFYTASDNVKMIAKGNDVIILGNKAEYWKSEKITKVYENALLKMLSNEDTIYVSADTLVSLDDEEDINKRLLAYHNVKIYKNDLQGIADSLVYFQADSVLSLFGNPALWTMGNQMTSDHIDIEIANQTISVLHLKSNSFVISVDSLNNFNQIKGRDMDAIFEDQQLSKVYVYGNGESIFFMLAEDESTLIGMNKILCSDMTLNFIDNQLSDITFYTNNEGKFIPPHELKEPDKRLTGFTWRSKEKPGYEDVVPEKYQDPNRVKREPENIETEIYTSPVPGAGKKKIPENMGGEKRKKIVKTKKN